MSIRSVEALALTSREGFCHSVVQRQGGCYGQGIADMENFGKDEGGDLKRNEGY